MGEALLVEWLSFYGPLSLAEMAQRLGVPLDVLTRAAEGLAAAGSWLVGELVSGRSESLYCDAANFETLLRLTRAARRPTLTPLPADRLPYFLAGWQGVTVPATEAEGLADRLERLACLPLPAGLWEEDILPARGRDYDPAWLDAAVAATGLAWYGAGVKKILFARAEDLDLAGFEPLGKGGSLFPDPRARYDFATLLDMAAASSRASTMWSSSRLTSST